MTRTLHLSLRSTSVDRPAQALASTTARRAAAFQQWAERLAGPVHAPAHPLARAGIAAPAAVRAAVAASHPAGPVAHVGAPAAHARDLVRAHLELVLAIARARAAERGVPVGRLAITVRVDGARIRVVMPARPGATAAQLAHEAGGRLVAYRAGLARAIPRAGGRRITLGTAPAIRPGLTRIERPRWTPPPARVVTRGSTSVDDAARHFFVELVKATIFCSAGIALALELGGFHLGWVLIECAAEMDSAMHALDEYRKALEDAAQSTWPGEASLDPDQAAPPDEDPAAGWEEGAGVDDGGDAYAADSDTSTYDESSAGDGGGGGGDDDGDPFFPIKMTQEV